VKPLPKPEIRIGGKFAPEAMKKSELGSVGAIGAGASGFDFTANFIVQSLEIIGKVRGKIVGPEACPGSNLTPAAVNILKNADPNTKVYIDAVIKGPDGKITSTTTGIKVLK
jgi:hypothetical protein